MDNKVELAEEQEEEKEERRNLRIEIEQVQEKEEEDHLSLFELDEAEKKVEEEDMELDLDDDDDDIEVLTLPLVSKKKYSDRVLPFYGLEVPVMKEDEFITDSMYRDDVDDDDDDLPPPPPPPADACSICYKRWSPLHHYCCLPCGHIFGAPCILKWLQTNVSGTCPQCNILCSLEDVRPLFATRLSIPAADKGIADQEISSRHFPFTKQGMVKFNKFEIGRRNFALKKRSDVKKWLAGVVGRKNDLMKRRTDLLDRRTSVLNRAKALEQRGGSLCRADALRLRAGALGRWADEYLRRAKACGGRAKALSQRAREYDQRVKALEGRLRYFYQATRTSGTTLGRTLLPQQLLVTKTNILCIKSLMSWILFIVFVSSLFVLNGVVESTHYLLSPQWLRTHGVTY